MYSRPVLAPRSIACNRSGPSPGYIVEVIEPIAMLALIGLVIQYQARSDHKSFLIGAGFPLALMAARRLNNALVAWTDLMDLTQMRVTNSSVDLEAALYLVEP